MNIANVIMENLLQRHKARAAMVLDALFVADLQLWPWMDFLTIKAYFARSGIFMGDGILRQGLFDLSLLGVLEKRQILTLQKGRPRWQYRLKKEQEIAELLGVALHESENRDAIPFEAFQTSRLYRKHKHYSFLKRLGTSELSRRKLGARLGVGGRSTFNYEIDMGIEVEQRMSQERLYQGDIAHAPEKRLKQNIFLEVFEGLSSRYMPYTKFILERELGRGNMVFKVKQITNRYKVA